MDNKKCVVLLGKTGNGKSATGNTLLGLYRFEEGGNTMSETKVVVNYTVEHCSNVRKTVGTPGHVGNEKNNIEQKHETTTWKVFDTPGHVDVEKEDLKHVQWSLENIERLMQICKEHNDVITAFLVVLNSQNRYSDEERKTIEAYETIFGKDFLKRHCIIVFTKIDSLHTDSTVWLKRQTGHLQDLLNKCENRVLLVCNKDQKNKDEDRKDKENKDKKEDNKTISPRQIQRKNIMDAIWALQKKYPEGYSYDDYMSYVGDRNRLLLKSELENLRASFNEQLSRISLNRTLLNNRKDRDGLLKEIAVLRHNIEKKDNKTGMLKELLDNLDREEELLPSMNCTIL